MPEKAIAPECAIESAVADVQEKFTPGFVKMDRTELFEFCCAVIGLIKKGYDQGFPDLFLSVVGRLIRDQDVFENEYEEISYLYRKAYFRRLKPLRSTKHVAVNRSRIIKFAFERAGVDLVAWTNRVESNLPAPNVVDLTKWRKQR